MLFNPLKQPITRTITVPLYYAGLNGKATLKEKDGAPKKITLNKNDELTLHFTLAPELLLTSPISRLR